MECFLHCCDDTHDPIPLPDGQDVTVGRKPELKIKNPKCSKNQVQLTANFAEKEVIVKQLGKIPSSIGIREIKRGETALLGPGGKICLWRQEYPNFVYFKMNPPIKKSPLKCTTEASENDIEGLKTATDLSDKHITKKRGTDKCDGNNDDSASYAASGMDLKNKNEINPVMKKSPSISIDAEGSGRNVDGLKEIKDESMNRKNRKRRIEASDNNDNDGGNNHKATKKAKISANTGTVLDIKDEQDVKDESMSRINRKRRIGANDNNDNDDDNHKATKKAKKSPDSSTDLDIKDEQDVKSTCKDTEDTNSPTRNMVTGSPCTTSTWEEMPQELLIYTSEGVEGRSKIAGFDMDGTIITTKSGKVFPTNAADWKIALPQVPGRLKNLWNDGYKIVLFTNQNGIAKNKVSVPDFKKKVENIVGTFNLPIQVLVSPGTGHYRKPSTGMWNHLCKKSNQGIDVSKEESFYIGDAAGRPAGWAPGKKKDFSCGDRAFAANVGIKFQTPEEFFLEKKPAAFNMPVFDPKSLDTNGPLYTPSTATLVAKEQEVVVMVGFPASGKSTFCVEHLVPHGYVRVNRDTLGSWQKCVAACRDALAKGKSVVIDNTNPDKESRKRYIECARAAKVQVRCFLMNVPKEHAQHNNTVRETLNTDKNYKHVGTMVFNMYKSSYVEPSCNEGFSEILQINFRPKLKDKRTRELYNQFL